MHSKSQEYIKNALNPILFKWTMLMKLPSVFFWGIKVLTLDSEKCEVKIPYRWSTQNPFHSIYFAAMAGAAELSTGALCQMVLADRPPHSMLVIDFRAEYFKKASSDVIFICRQGKELVATLNSLTLPGSTAQLTMFSEGYNIKNELVAKAFITWSFKLKSNEL